MYHQPSQRTSYGAPSHRYSQSRPHGYAPPPPAGSPYPPQQLHHRPSQSQSSAHGGAPDQARLWQWFCQVDTDRSGEISVNELHAALINGDWSRFDIDTVKMLMGMFDVDRSGTIGFNEFQGLWKYIVDWQKAFKYFDRDGSGTIDGHELANALQNFGYNLSPTLMSLIEQKYAPAPIAGGGPKPGITFDRFVRACVLVRTLTEAFKTRDTDHDGWIQVNYEDFMVMVLSAP
ncbi:EF-hand domain-containing protein [Phanerochaete sordida]|uniref:EF-hand domain-containing protein n=1 Tax=Phanerochaete sordida TaxID=48140 RepID=A0A9P3GA93_9APHY|nr:EF-hand domain-containing protein [Phanerochaete sordida]